MATPNYHTWDHSTAEAAWKDKESRRAVVAGVVAFLCLVAGASVVKSSSAGGGYSLLRPLSLLGSGTGSGIYKKGLLSGKKYLTMRDCSQ
jgi:hypothetical protein